MASLEGVCSKRESEATHVCADAAEVRETSVCMALRGSALWRGACLNMSMYVLGGRVSACRCVCVRVWVVGNSKG